MEALRQAVRRLYVPLLLLGVNGAAVAAVAAGRPEALAPLFAVALAFTFGAERIAPHQPEWNRPRGDLGRDAVHAVVNELASAVSLASIPLATAALGSGPRWPAGWPFALQVGLAILVFDLGITLAHCASHRVAWLWRFHAVHHSVTRMYGLNGLMKHPVHQGIEAFAGSAPLLALGLPFEVGLALAFCTATQLLAQHANVDMRLGPWRGVLAVAAVHRFHHRASAELGDVNFGLFTTLGDRLLGTFHDAPRDAPFRSDELGVAGDPGYPAAYLAQLAAPFRRRPA